MHTMYEVARLNKYKHTLNAMSNYALAQSPYDCHQACVYKVDVNPGKNKDICFRSNTSITDYLFDGNE